MSKQSKQTHFQQLSHLRILNSQRMKVIDSNKSFSMRIPIFFSQFCISTKFYFPTLKSLYFIFNLFSEMKINEISENIFPFQSIHIIIFRLFLNDWKISIHISTEMTAAFSEWKNLILLFNSRFQLMTIMDLNHQNKSLPTTHPIYLFQVSHIPRILISLSMISSQVSRYKDILNINRSQHHRIRQISLLQISIINNQSHQRFNFDIHLR
jgi:hypothetical protein